MNYMYLSVADLSGKYLEIRFIDIIRYERAHDGTYIFVKDNNFTNGERRIISQLSYEGFDILFKDVQQQSEENKQLAIDNLKHIQGIYKDVFARKSIFEVVDIDYGLFPVVVNVDANADLPPEVIHHINQTFHTSQ